MNADRSMDDPTRRGSTIAQTAPAATAASTAGNASAMTRRMSRSYPITVSRATVSSRSADPSARPSSTMNRPNAAAAAMLRVMMTAPPCSSGEPAREASTAERKVIVLPGRARLATADSRAWSIPEPLTRMMSGAGRPSGPGRVRSAMMANAPPPGRAGVALSVPATRTVTGPTGATENS